MKQWFSISEILLNYDFIMLWAGQTVSIFGSLIGKIVLPFIVIYTLSASPTQIAWVRTAEIVPGMIAGLLAGVWIDRLRRRPIMIWADLFRGISIGSIPLLYWLGHLTLLQVILVAAVVSVLTVCFDVSYEAYIPTLVGSSQLVDANSKVSASASVAEVSGFGIAGALFQWLGGAYTLSIDVVSFIVSALTLLWIRKPEPVQSTPVERQSIFFEAWAGLKVLTTNRLLLTLAGIDSLSSIFNGAMGTIYVLYISRSLHVAPATQGLLYAFGGISSFFGAAVAERVLSLLGLGKTLVTMSLLGLLGIALVPIAFGPSWLIILFLIGQQLLGDGPDTIYDIQVTSFRQTVTQNRLLGRVNASWRVSNWLFMLIGTLSAGLLAETIGIRATFYLALALRALGSLGLLLSPISNIRVLPVSGDS